MKHILSILMLLPLGIVQAAVIKAEKPPTLQWAPCHLDLGQIQKVINITLYCATLNVPLDYTDPDCPEQLPLQLFKVNATKEPFKGSVVFNPGGPGDTGAEELASMGLFFNSVLGGHFDLISFNPRGTGKTIPFACNPWNQTSSKTNLSRRQSLPKENMTDLLLTKDWHDSTQIAEICYQAQNKTGNFIGTAFVARDVMQIVDALQEDGMLRYWGVSYGTLLGSTIASMFPDRIDRMYLDSVVNPLDYMSGYDLTSAADSDQALAGFFEECVSSGPDYCLIANFSGPSTTAQDLLDIFHGVLQDLIDNPQYLPAGGLTWTWNKDPPLPLIESIKGYVFTNLYEPIGWPFLADVLNHTFYRDYQFFYLPVEYSNSTPYNEGTEAFWGIECSDLEYRASSPEDMLWLVKEQYNVSGFADIVQTNIWPCYQWKMAAAERYTGNFSVKTSYPVLITNGHHDPITPYASAVNLSTGLEGSVLVTNGGNGHTWLSDPSLCLAYIVKAYFNNGTLPPPDTYCEPDNPAFEINLKYLTSGNYSDRRRGTAPEVGLSEEDLDMMEAMYKFAYHMWEKGQRYGVRRWRR